MKKLATVLCAIFVLACATAQDYEFSYYQEFDSEGRVTYEKDAYGYEAQGIYDKKGNQIYYKSTVNGEPDAEGWFTYYSNGEFKTCRIIDGNEEWFYEYDKDGNIKYVETPSGDTYRYFYDSYGRNTYAFSTGGEKAFFAYTDDATYAKYISKDGTVFYEYDDYGNLISSYSTDGTLTSNTYDDYDYYDDDDYDYDDYDYSDYDYDDAEYDYDDYDDYNYDDEDYDDGYYKEYDKYGNITLMQSSYYSEKYEYTYYRDGTVKTVTCYYFTNDDFLE